MKMIDRQTFFDKIRSTVFGGTMTAQQVEGTNVMLSEWELRRYENLAWLAYMLATAKHETAHRMWPVRETLAATDAAARRNLAGVWYAAPNPITGCSYYGRGLVQLTHFDNYLKMEKLLKVPLTTQPDLALDIDVSCAVLFEGMTRGDSHIGDFTGRSLEDYFSPGQNNWLGARAIINGNDRAAAIADIAIGFYNALADKAKPRFLRYGSSGLDVTQLQEQLARLQLYSKPIDGQFGDGTRAAVIAFQKAHGLIADGIAGELTLARLKEEL
jgi:hypothetical protein